MRGLNDRKFSLKLFGYPNRSFVATSALVAIGLAFGLISRSPCWAQQSRQSGFSQVDAGAGKLSEKPLVAKADVIARLKVIQAQNVQAIESVESGLRKTLMESQDVSLKSSDTIAVERALRSLPERIARLQERRDELVLRREFFDQLMFKIDSQWNGLNLAEFIETRCLEMAAQDLTTQASENQSWRFLLYLSIAVREIPERKEDVLAFVFGYLEFSGIRSPKSPLAYLDSRNYTNGAISQKARPESREDAGAFVEKRLKEISLAVPNTAIKSRTNPPAPEIQRADLELRVKRPGVLSEGTRE